MTRLLVFFLVALFVTLGCSHRPAQTAATFTRAVDIETPCLFRPDMPENARDLTCPKPNPIWTEWMSGMTFRPLEDRCGTNVPVIGNRHFSDAGYYITAFYSCVSYTGTAEGLRKFDANKGMAQINLELFLTGNGFETDEALAQGMTLFRAERFVCDMQSADKEHVGYYAEDFKGAKVGLGVSRAADAFYFAGCTTTGGTKRDIIECLCSYLPPQVPPTGETQSGAEAGAKPDAEPDAAPQRARGSRKFNLDVKRP